MEFENRIRVFRVIRVYFDCLFQIYVITVFIKWNNSSRGRSIFDSKEQTSNILTKTMCGYTECSVQNAVFFVTFNAIISHIFLKNFIEIPQVVQNILRFSPTKLSIFIDCLLTLPCYKETNDVSIYMSVDDVIIFFYFQPILIGFLTIA